MQEVQVRSYSAAHISSSRISQRECKLKFMPLFHAEDPLKSPKTSQGDQCQDRKVVEGLQTVP